jgi:signal transduction histidine kinase
MLAGEHRQPVTMGVMGAAAREARAVLVNDARCDPRYVPMSRSTGITAELAVPILAGGRVAGLVNVEGSGPFDDEDAATLTIVADQLAAAVENARLYEAAQRAAALEERQRIARDLHDSVTQTLFSLTLIAESLESAWRRDAAEGARRCGRLLELSGSALAEMRALLVELRPEVRVSDPLGGGEPPLARVAREGLAAALAHHLAELRRDRPALETSLDTARYGARRAPAPVEEALFRIAQEATANVVKHASAERLTVRLGRSRRGVRLTVTDDGAGFTPGDVRRGFGLLSMRERAERLGGRVRVQRARGGGTVVSAFVRT